jgi:hypothetical protein
MCLEYLEGHKGLGNNQKAEVAWLEKRYRETNNEGYRTRSWTCVTSFGNKGPD